MILKYSPTKLYYGTAFVCTKSMWKTYGVGNQRYMFVEHYTRNTIPMVRYKKAY
jgi:hypothetical protein